MGYGIAIWRDQNDELAAALNQEGASAMILVGKYPGYASATNTIIGHVFQNVPEATWCVAGGDDTDPDPNWHPDHIALQLEAHFGGTFGVMQPTGDRWADGSIDLIAGSPWIGREWARRAHRGTGALCHRFFHMCVDNAAQYAAEREGVYLRRPDLMHRHNHFCRVGEAVDWSQPIPPHLVKANSDMEWTKARATLELFKLTYEQDWRPIA